MKNKLLTFVMFMCVSTAYAMPAGNYECPSVDDLNKAIDNHSVNCTRPHEPDDMHPPTPHDGLCTWTIAPITKDDVLFNGSHDEAYQSVKDMNLIALKFVTAKMFTSNGNPARIMCTYLSNQPANSEGWSVGVMSDYNYDFSNCKVNPDVRSNIKCV